MVTITLFTGMDQWTLGRLLELDMDAPDQAANAIEATGEIAAKFMDLLEQEREALDAQLAVGFEADA